MPRMWLRLISVAVLGAGVASGFHAFSINREMAAARRADRTFDARAWGLVLSLAELRAAQQAYVAAGQDPDYWAGDVATRLENLTNELASLTPTSTLNDTVLALDEATALAEALLRMDARAREHAAAGQELVASDLLFADGIELGRAAAQQIEHARQIEREARDATADDRRQSQLLALCGALGAGILFALLLSPFPAGGRRADDGTPAAGEAPSQPDGRLLFDLEPDAGDAARASDAADAATAPPPPELPAPAPDMQQAADLCLDMGRCPDDAAAWPPLLERAAHLLNASRIIVWVRTGAGDALRPAIAHGYPASALARLGTIPCDSDNVAAAAYRGARTQIVAGDGESAGAIVAPLASPDDLTGVMTLEMNDGWESSAAVQSMATILAAQLATRVAADPATPAATGFEAS